jgi:hypothetical protein
MGTTEKFVSHPYGIFHCSITAIPAFHAGRFSRRPHGTQAVDPHQANFIADYKSAVAGLGGCRQAQDGM